MTDQTFYGSKVAVKTTLPKLQKLKNKKLKFSVLTAYDFSLAKAIDQAGIEVILVGDSLGMTIQGHKSTLPVTINDMIYHTKAVLAGAKSALIMVDMPFATYSTPTDALTNAAQLMRAGGEIVKLEGKQWLMPIIEKLCQQGIPVCAHFGLTPQFVNQLGGYKIQGRDDSSAQEILRNAISAEKLGAKLILLECVPTELAQTITEAVSIPVIGIGAGKHTDAQVLVIQDILGLTHKPARFAKNYLAQTNSIQAAIQMFGDEVKNGDYPKAEHSFES